MHHSRQRDWFPTHLMTQLKCIILINIESDACNAHVNPLTGHCVIVIVYKVDIYNYSTMSLRSLILILRLSLNAYKCTASFCQRLAAMQSKKKKAIPYSKMIEWIGCRISFSLLRSSVISEEQDLPLLEEHCMNPLNSRQQSGKQKLYLLP